MRTLFKQAILVFLFAAGFLPAGVRAQPDLYGFLESGAYIFVRDSVRLAREINELRLKFDASSDQVGLFASTSLFHTGGGIQADLWQGYIDYYGRFFDLRAGKQIITWGTGDGINPTDNLNPLDLKRKGPFAPQEDKKLPVTMVQGNLYWQGLRVTGVWVPDFHPFVLPDTSVWPLASPTLTPPRAGMILDGMQPPAPPVFPSNTLANSEYALRLSGTLAGVDLSTSYYQGWEDFPTLHPNFTFNGIDSQGNQHVIAEPALRYHRLSMIGGDFVTSLFGIGLRGEGGYFLTEDAEGTNPAVKDPYWHYLLGIDYTFRNGLYVNIQYVYGMFDRYGLNLPAAENRLLTLGATLDLGNYTSLEVGAMYALEDENYLLKPRYIRSVGNAVDLVIGAYLIGGNTKHHFGAFDANDQIYTEIRYNF